jgi:hypothetical protein
MSRGNHDAVAGTQKDMRPRTTQDGDHSGQGVTTRWLISPARKKQDQSKTSNVYKYCSMVAPSMKARSFGLGLSKSNSSPESGHGKTL